MALHGDARGHITDENLLQHSMHAHDYHSESTVQQHVSNPSGGARNEANPGPNFFSRQHGKTLALKLTHTISKKYLM